MGRAGVVERVGLVACVKTKRPAAAPARDLYDSPLFVGARRAVEAACDRWYILSAHHGLLDPDEVIEPYDDTLVRAPRRRKRAWAQRVLRQIDEQLGDLHGRTVEIHAGKDYYDHGLVAGLVARGAVVEIPTAGLPLGRKLAHYAGTRSSAPNTSWRPPPPRGDPGPATSLDAPRGKYRPLDDHLVALGTSRWDATFREVEAVLDVALPPAARAHAAWWSNATTSHSHARAWVAAGWRTQDVRLASEQVTFVRAPRT